MFFEVYDTDSPAGEVWLLNVYFARVEFRYSLIFFNVQGGACQVLIDNDKVDHYCHRKVEHILSYKKYSVLYLCMTILNIPSVNAW